MSKNKNPSCYAQIDTLAHSYMLVALLRARYAPLTRQALEPRIAVAAVPPAHTVPRANTIGVGHVVIRAGAR
eukprot:1150218-Amorphochlora_amoeboformis.AAC.1